MSAGTDAFAGWTVYLIDNPHAAGMLIGYGPDARLGFITDLWSPSRDPLPAQITPPLASLVAAVKKAGIEPLRSAGDHRRCRRLCGPGGAGRGIGHEGSG